MAKFTEYPAPTPFDGTELFMLGQEDGTKTGNIDDIVVYVKEGKLTFEDLNDVVLTSISNGDQIEYQDGEWVNAVPAAGVTTFAALTDTLVTTPTEGQILRWDATEEYWYNDTLASVTHPDHNDLANLDGGDTSYYHSDQAINTTDTPTFTGMGDLSKSTDSIGSVMIAGAGNATMTGDNNILLGLNAGLSIVGGGDNVIIGQDAGKDGNAYASVLVGKFAGQNNVGSDNVILGSWAGTGIVDGAGSDNVILGLFAGYELNDGSENIIIGNQAGYSLIDGGSNILMGYNAGKEIFNGTSNVCIGDGAGLGYQATGGHNVYIGSFTGQDLQDGDDNVGLGRFACSNVDTGDQNIGIGTWAGQYVTSGTNNIAFGSQAGFNVSTGSYNISIGKGASPSAADATYQCVIGGTGADAVKVGLGGQDNPQYSLDVLGDINWSGIVLKGAVEQYIEKRDGWESVVLVAPILANDYATGSVQFDNGVIIMCTNGGQTLRSLDDGQTWDLTTPAGALNNTDYVWTANNHGYLYDDAGSLRRSDVNGDNWVVVSTPGAMSTTAEHPLAYEGDVLLFGIRLSSANTSTTIIRSDDNGETWATIHVIANINVRENIYWTGTDSFLLSSTLAGDLYYRSSDAGLTWDAGTALPTGVGEAILGTSPNGVLYWRGSTTGYFYRTDDQGDTLVNVIPNVAERIRSRIIVGNQYVFLQIDGYDGQYRSIDGGLTYTWTDWATINVPAGSALYDIQQQGNGDMIAWMADGGYYDSAYRSKDNGATWVQINTTGMEANEYTDWMLLSSTGKLILFAEEELTPGGDWAITNYIYQDVRFGGSTTATGAGTATSAGHIIQDEGVDIAESAYLNFVGTGVTVADLAGVTTVTIPDTSLQYEHYTSGDLELNTGYFIDTTTPPTAVELYVLSHASSTPAYESNQYVSGTGWYESSPFGAGWGLETSNTGTNSTYALSMSIGFNNGGWMSYDLTELGLINGKSYTIAFEISSSNANYYPTKRPTWGVNSVQTNAHDPAYENGEHGSTDGTEYLPYSITIVYDSTDTRYMLWYSGGLSFRLDNLSIYDANLLNYLPLTADTPSVGDMIVIDDFNKNSSTYPIVITSNAGGTFKLEGADTTLTLDTDGINTTLTYVSLDYGWRKDIINVGDYDQSLNTTDSVTFSSIAGDGSLLTNLPPTSWDAVDANIVATGLDGTIDLGTLTDEFKDLHLSGAVYKSGTELTPVVASDTAPTDTTVFWIDTSA